VNWNQFTLTKLPPVLVVKVTYRVWLPDGTGEAVTGVKLPPRLCLSDELTQIITPQHGARKIRRTRNLLGGPARQVFTVRTHECAGIGQYAVPA
jgi:hypothetical protein